MQNIKVIGVENLKQLIDYLNDEITIDREITDIDRIFEKNIKYNMDFKNVKGQKAVKRALEVAAAGRT